MTTMEIIFCGTSHIDPAGEEKLNDFLNSTRPDIIALEVSRYAVLFRKTIGSLYKKILYRNINKYKIPLNNEINNTLNYFNLPYEYTTSKKYCIKNYSKLRLIDISFFSFIRLFPSYKILNKKNLISLSLLKVNRFTSERSIAKKIFREYDIYITRNRLLSFEKDGLIKCREKILSKRLRKIIGKNLNKKILYIGGWEHLMDDPEKRTIYSSLDHPKKRKILFI